METKFKKHLEFFLENYRLSKYKKDELICQPGDFFSSVYFIKSGYMRIYSICRNGQEATINILKPFSFLPQFFVNPKTKNRFYLEAMTPVDAWHVPKREMINFMISNPEIFPEAVDSIAQAFKELQIRIEDLVSGNAYTKVVSILLSFASETSTKKSQTTLDLSLTHRIIASLTGLTRETVTLQILKLKKKGLISGKGRNLVINDIAKLKEESACTSEENS